MKRALGAIGKLGQCWGSFLLALLSFATAALSQVVAPENGLVPTILWPTTTPLDLETLETKQTCGISITPCIYPTNPPFTADTIALTGLTVPSLWWAKDQFGSRLLENWLAYPAAPPIPARIDLVVSRPDWNSLDYLERYAFVHHMGTVARGFGYNLRIFNRQQVLLATYTCDFTAPPLTCALLLNNSGREWVWRLPTPSPR
ncbi:hypothetical protein [Neosynechococcus sphagnicola]|uniref:hypothetical protein n=1 Tax=Neosynechococcus sphagnicola TaxID=1501145 RepID=UPI00068FBA8F|nr:hypothetical protein [Neosynechococcus sphagnicola]